MAELPLTVTGDVLPLLRAVEQAAFYGTITLQFEDGCAKDIEIRQRMRLRQQVRMVIKRLIGV